MPLQLGPPPGRAEDAIIVSGFTEEQLATLKRQVRQLDCAAPRAVRLRARMGTCAFARLRRLLCFFASRPPDTECLADR